MTRQRSIGLLIGALALGAGCGSSGDPNCDNSDGWICHPGGVPFVNVAFDNSDLCGGPVAMCDLAPNQPPGTTTAKLTQPAPGKLCLSGTVAAGGWAQMVLWFPLTNKDGSQVFETFDANALGITQAAFTIDSPPSGGVTVGAAITGSLFCTPGEICFTYGFTLMTTPTSTQPVSITAPGPQVAPFANFVQTDSTMSTAFDTSGLTYLSFGVGTGDYDFCLEGIKFLDAAGTEVSP